MIPNHFVVCLNVSIFMNLFSTLMVANQHHCLFINHTVCTLCIDRYHYCRYHELDSV